MHEPKPPEMMTDSGSMMMQQMSGEDFEKMKKKGGPGRKPMGGKKP